MRKHTPPIIGSVGLRPGFHRKAFHGCSAGAKLLQLHRESLQSASETKITLHQTSVSLVNLVLGGLDSPTRLRAAALAFPSLSPQARSRMCWVAWGVLASIHIQPWIETRFVAVLVVLSTNPCSECFIQLCPIKELCGERLCRKLNSVTSLLCGMAAQPETSLICLLHMLNNEKR